MPGYDGFSKSNSAVEAEGDGRYPLTVAARVLAKRRGLSLRLARAILEEVGTSEWHHTGKFYCQTDYYDLAAAEAWMDDPENAGALEELKKPAEKVEAAVYENCTVSWLEWSGTRNHPKCEKHEAQGCRVEIKGQTATVVLPGGMRFQKRITTRGFTVRLAPDEYEIKSLLINNG